MDYKDYQTGVTKEFFWFKAKRQLIDVLLNKLNSEKKLKILNVGVGTGEDLLVIKQFGEIYGIDTEPEALKLIPKELIFEKKVCDACHIPYPDDFFDLVVAFDMLEHSEDDIAAIKEINRVLKPNGFFVFTVPAFNFLYSSHDKALNHFRRYDKSIIKNRLANFLCLELGYWVFSLFLPVAIQRLLKRKECDSKVHYIVLPKFINNIFFSLLRIENLLIKHRIALPIGITIYGIFQKS